MATTSTTSRPHNAVQVGQWRLTDSWAKQMRAYLLRGGFFMCTSDFWPDSQWANFMESMTRVFPDEPVVDIPNDDQIFHSVYDLTGRYSGHPARVTFKPARDREVRRLPSALARYLRPRSRVMVAILSGATSTIPWMGRRPGFTAEIPSALGIRIGVNYIVYALSPLIVCAAWRSTLPALLSQ